MRTHVLSYPISSPKCPIFINQVRKIHNIFRGYLLNHFPFVKTRFLFFRIKSFTWCFHRKVLSVSLTSGPVRLSIFLLAPCTSSLIIMTLLKEPKGKVALCQGQLMPSWISNPSLFQDRQHWCHIQQGVQTPRQRLHSSLGVREGGGQTEGQWWSKSLLYENLSRL